MVNDSMVPVGQVAESQREPGTMQVIAQSYACHTCTQTHIPMGTGWIQDFMKGGDGPPF